MNRHRPFLTRALPHLAAASILYVPAGVLAGTTAERSKPNGSSHENHAQKGRDMYRTELQMDPPTAHEGQPVTLVLTVRDAEGGAVTRLTQSHEREMHVFVVSKDLRHFAHIHPSLTGNSFLVPHTFASAGEYTVFADYQQPGRGQVIDRHKVQVDGAARPQAAPLTETPRTQRVDGLAVTLHSDAEIRAGEAAMLHFEISDAATKEPVEDLEPYLGSMAHFMVLSADGQDFVHVHALDGRSRPSRVSAHAVFPRAGLYELWGQVQRQGKVATVPFVVRVHEAKAGTNSASASGHGAHPAHQH